MLGITGCSTIRMGWLTRAVKREEKGREEEKRRGGEGKRRKTENVGHVILHA